LRDLRVNDIARKLVAAKEIDFLFKVNFLTLFTNTMGKADGLKGQICLDVVRRLCEDSIISDIDWSQNLKIVCWGFYIFMQEAEGFIGSLEISEKEALFKRAKEKLAAICSERVLLENLMRKASSDYPGDGKFVELQEKYVQVFRDPISFDVDVDAGSDWAGSKDDGRSTSGFLFFLGNNAFTWSSKKKLIVTLSSCEEEYIAATSCVCHAIWLRSMLKELHMEQEDATEIYVDNKSAIELAKNLVYHNRTRAHDGEASRIMKKFLE
ncbi:retrovirus-related pol polyprotein from transposon TNT 1-94, partial [Tanacetum coccineum]